MKKKLAMTLAVSMLAGSLLSACGGQSASNGTTASGDAAQQSGASAAEGTDIPAVSEGHEGYLNVCLSADIMTADVQKTSNDYEIPMNIYDTLVQIKVADDGSSSIEPMLAESWEEMVMAMMLSAFINSSSQALGEGQAVWLAHLGCSMAVSNVGRSRVSSSMKSLSPTLMIKGTLEICSSPSDRLMGNRSQLESVTIFHFIWGLL